MGEGTTFFGMRKENTDFFCCMPIFSFLCSGKASPPPRLPLHSDMEILGIYKVFRRQSVKIQRQEQGVTHSLLVFGGGVRTCQGLLVQEKST